MCTNNKGFPHDSEIIPNITARGGAGGVPMAEDPPPPSPPPPHTHTSVTISAIIDNIFTFGPAGPMESGAIFNNSIGGWCQRFSSSFPARNKKHDARGWPRARCGGAIQVRLWMGIGEGFTRVWHLEVYFPRLMKPPHSTLAGETEVSYTACCATLPTQRKSRQLCRNLMQMCARNLWASKWHQRAAGTTGPPPPDINYERRSSAAQLNEVT